MSTKVLVLSPSSKGRSRRRSSLDGTAIAHDAPPPGSTGTGAGHALDPFDPPDDGRDGLHSFLHKDLRISSDVADFYCTSLIENGYDDVPSLQDATEHDLKELGVKIGHVRRIKRAVFSSCLRNGDRPRRSTDPPPLPGDAAAEDATASGGGSGRAAIDGSLLSEYARQEMSNRAPPPSSSSRERDVDVDLASAKEFLIRKQAEKIASLEAKLASAGIRATSSHGGGSGGDVPEEHSLSHASRGSRAPGSADTHASKKLTPEERLEKHRQRKLRENKYREKTGVWEPPPPKKKEKGLAKKVSENDELVHKLTSDPTHRKKIDEDERRAKRSFRKSLGEDSAKALSPSSSAVERLRSDDSVHRQDRRSSSRRSSRGDDRGASFSSGRPHHHRSLRVSCETCGSTRDCEPDIDNPGVYYCKSCWEEYEEGLDAPPEAHPSPPAAPPSQAPAKPPVVPHEEDPSHRALWVVHDNPQLGEKIIYSGPRRMECMLETKEPGKKNCVRIVVGDIDFSGKVQLSGIGNVSGRETEVGAECIRVRNVKGYCVDHNQAASRLSRD
ncbi:hypothetical protein ACHAWF_001967, partial [Thalassiosira exigua]